MDDFWKILTDVAGPLGVQLPPPKVVQISNDDASLWAKEILQYADPSIQTFVVCLLPTGDENRYNAVKDVLVTRLALPSQCVNMR